MLRKCTLIMFLLLFSGIEVVTAATDSDSKRKTFTQRIDELEAKQENILKGASKQDERLAALEKKLKAFESKSIPAENAEELNSKVSELEDKVLQLEQSVSIKPQLKRKLSSNVTNKATKLRASVKPLQAKLPERRVKSIAANLLDVNTIQSSASALAPALVLGIDVDYTFVSSYLWHGYDLFDDVAAHQPSVNIVFGDSGFSFNYWTSYAGASGTTTTSTVDGTEFDYTAAYECSLFGGPATTEIAANYIYYDFPSMPTKAGDAQELGVGFIWPNLLGGVLVPSYYTGKIWESRSNSTLGSHYGGWIHVFGLGCDVDAGGTTLSLSSDLTYNAGYGGATTEYDWSHATFGISTSFEIGDLAISPGLFYQVSMEDTVNTEDELMFSISTTYSF
ncbi:MAG: hypothetical protein FVQ80_02240 [Planctomycetes bacterium]|nr:hypothetical protein [Planctomycetota bacterium]